MSLLAHITCHTSSSTTCALAVLNKCDVLSTEEANVACQQRRLMHVEVSRGRFGISFRTTSSMVCIRPCFAFHSTKPQVARVTVRDICRCHCVGDRLSRDALWTLTKLLKSMASPGTDRDVGMLERSMSTITVPFSVNTGPAR